MRALRSVVAVGIVSIGFITAVSSQAISASSGPASPADYVSFRGQITTIAQLRLDDPKNVEKARQMLLAHNEKALSHGWVAQCSQIASRDENFAENVRKAAKKHGGTDAFVARLTADPSSVLEVSGWQDASADVTSAVMQDAANMQSLSHRLTEIAYGRTANEARYAADAQKSAGITGSVGRARTPRNASPMMTRILALGAVMALQQDSARVDSAAATLVADKQNDQCLRWSDLNLKQCLAAARDNAERAYCLSTEAIASRSDCWNKVVQAGS